MDSPLDPGTAMATSATDHLQCPCGYLAFRCIYFPEPGVMRLTCFGCGLTHTINVSVASNLTAWRAAETGQEATELPEAEVEHEKPEPAKRTGYKYEAML